ncbi:unnamed protein product [Phyllotreta striolata]|uniref:Complex 1 LYR protein domain-containing protein n=1 Tax=Phyllotreta striolata TaxID=444603 RepID=A0A9N9TXQ4_PHYSR|nr:unnamed protein product [Phyllotreta striolata]
MSQRSRVINLYKTFLNLSKDWPKGRDHFRRGLHKSFSKNKDEKDPDNIEKMIKHGEFVVKEIETLYMLKKYRTLKKHTFSNAGEKSFDQFGAISSRIAPGQLALNRKFDRDSPEPPEPPSETPPSFAHANSPAKIASERSKIRVGETAPDVTIEP